MPVSRIQDNRECSTTPIGNPPLWSGYVSLPANLVSIYQSICSQSASQSALGPPAKTVNYLPASSLLSARLTLGVKEGIRHFMGPVRFTYTSSPKPIGHHAQGLRIMSPWLGCASNLGCIHLMTDFPGEFVLIE